MSNHTICIYERPRPDAKDPTCCTVKITVDGNAIKGRSVIKDPFSHYPREHRHSRVARYLEDALGEDEFRQSSAVECEKWIREYRQDLFSSLRLGDLSFDRSDVEVNIFPYTDPERRLLASDKTLPILSIYWELLELVPRRGTSNGLDHTDRRNRTRKKPSSLESASEWPVPVSRVYVRRVVPAVRVNQQALHHSVPQQTPWSAIAGSKDPVTDECRVLLVIARKLKAEPGEYQISPSFIKKELLQIFEDLNRRHGRGFYRLEVVRPGSFQELRLHLEAAKKPFQIVHFDMHGLVKCIKPDCRRPRNEWRVSKRANSCRVSGDGHQGSAFLTFAARGPGGSLVTEDVLASDIARLLQDHQIRCVALNACESARTNDGEDSNLSYTFLLHGISNVVAMSFRASDAMFALYFREFYAELFEYRRDFSAATSDARSALIKLDRRESARDGPVHMEDWFVPVTYCDGKVIMMPNPSNSWDEEEVIHVDPDGRRHYISKVQSLTQGEPQSTRVTRITRTLLEPRLITACVVASVWIACLAGGRKELRHLVVRFAALLATTASPFCLWALSKTALGLRCERSIRASEITCRILDNNMLNIENELKSHQPVVLHGLRKATESQSLLENLIFVWIRTNFVDQVVVIPAVWFYQPKLFQKLRVWCCKRVHHRNCCFGEQTQSREALLPQQRMFIVTDLEKLFPQDPVPDWNWVQVKLQADARFRFKEFLYKYFHDAEESGEGAVVVSAGRKTPFLLLSGSPRLQDEDLLKTTLDRMDIVGMRSTLFGEASDDDVRTARIEKSNEIDRKQVHRLVNREVSTLSQIVSGS